jgi:Zn-dependent M28 family amino/carboxypeptidase
MLGGHMDSWHAGTGATDNGAGVAVGMEAVRIIQALGLKPRRTIRIALWTGEEQGLLGSRAYVAQHFGKMETPATAAATSPTAGDGVNANPPRPVLVKMAEYDKLAGYFNLDNGNGPDSRRLSAGQRRARESIPAMAGAVSRSGCGNALAFEYGWHRSLIV